MSLPTAVYDGVEIEVSEPVLWPVERINFRMHPCTDFSGVEKYKNGELEWKPIIVCRRCFVVLDGWHRLAAAWQMGKRYIEVQFTDFHLNGASGRCYCDQVNWIDTLRPWVDMDCVSGSYHRKDFKVVCFANCVNQLRRAGPPMPICRDWEQAKAILSLGVVQNRKILDVGSRESIVPAYLADKGAEVTAIDLNTDMIKPHKGVTIMEADARELPFEDNYFDHVVSTACIKHIPEDTKAVTEMVRVVKPHGLVALSFDFGQEYAEFPSEATGRRIYDADSVYARLHVPHAVIQEPADFGRCDWADWPVESQAPSVYAKGVNVQVAFLLLRKVP